MASTRQLVYVYAIDSDPVLGLGRPSLVAAQEHFDLITTEELLKDTKKYEKVTGAIVTPVSSLQFYEHLPRFTHLKAVASLGVGTNHIDFPRFAKLGIKVSITPGCVHDTVAEMIMALVLASARNLIVGDCLCRGITTPDQFPICRQSGLQVKGSTVGIVGMGNIGLTTARLLKAFGANIIYHNRNRRSASDELTVGAVYYPDLLEMLSVSDFVVLVCTLTPHTKHLIGMPQLAAMKPTAVLINVARGPVVDTDALVETLRSNQIRGAALDVTDPEPLPEGHPLLTEHRVILTPHWGYNTLSAKVATVQMALDNLRAVLIDGVAMPNEIKGEKS